jgi:DNA invertase Pin-like site-specific DNA recombinase
MRITGKSAIRFAMLIGYARVSTIHQSLDRQIASLRAAGCDKIYREKASGKELKGRPQLERAIDQMATGDVLVLAEWDRATRSMMDGVHLMQRVHARGAAIKVLDKPHLDLTTAIGQGILAFLSALAQDERERILKRANEGRQAARAKGRRFGRKPKLTDHQHGLVREMRTAGQTTRHIARHFGVHQSTISRIL